MNLPNTISLARLIAVPFMIFLILREDYLTSFWLFVVAAISDGVDGAIAKRFNMVSRLGTYLDPIADKVLLVGTYVALGHKGEIAILIVILVVFRDAMIVGGFLLQSLYRQNHTLPEPIFTSKVNTLAQLLFATTVMMELGYAVDTGWLRDGMGYIVGATTLLSGALYLVTWARRMASMEDAQ